MSRSTSWSFSSQAFSRVLPREIISAPNLVGERIIFGSYDSFLYCLSAKDGAVIWKLETDERVHASPAVTEGVTFIAGCDGQLRAVDIEKGIELTRTNLRGNVIASPTIISGLAYVGTYGGQFHAVDWKKGEVVWTYEHAESQEPFFASPAVSGERVVVAGRDRLVNCN